MGRIDLGKRRKCREAYVDEGNNGALVWFWEWWGNGEGGENEALVLGDDDEDGGSTERGDRGFVTGWKGKMGRLGEGEWRLRQKKM